MRARENPFRVERLHALAFRFEDGGDLDDLLRRLRQHGGRGAIVGPRGSGKSTLLEQLGRRFRAEGLDVRTLRVGAGQTSLTAAERADLCDRAGPTTAILFDGAGHLRSQQWRQIEEQARDAEWFVITAHRRGRMRTALRTSTSAELLRDLAGTLGYSLAPDDASALFRQHRGNLRDALRALYDRCAGRDGVTSPDLR